MGKDETPPKWAFAFFITCAVIMAVSLVIVLVQSEWPPWYQIVVQAGMVILCVWLALDSKRKSRKDADAP